MFMIHLEGYIFKHAAILNPDLNQNSITFPQIITKFSPTTIFLKIILTETNIQASSVNHVPI